MRFFDRHEVERLLSFDVCIPAVKEAMSALSRGQTRHMPRAVLPIAEGRLLGLMGGALGADDLFGSKVVSVYPGNFAKGMPAHQGVVLLFDPESGAPICAADASAITAIRTAAASAVATDALARQDATRLTILGYGEQANAHVAAIARVRALRQVTVWGRAYDRAKQFADIAARTHGVEAHAAASVEEAVREADIICTVTAAREPILLGRWVGAGVHVNVVGSSIAGPAEIDNDLVAKSRFVADCRENVLQAGAEFLRAKQAGLVKNEHIVAEIGEVLNGAAQGRQTPEEITIYKSLGHIVQDLAAARAVMQVAS